MHHTLHNSQGSVHHHQQLINLILGLQGAAATWHWWRTRGQPSAAPGEAEAGQNLMADWTRQATVAAYVVSAVSKMWYSKGFWIWNVPNLGLQLRKAADQDYYDTLTHSTLGHEWLPEWCVHHPWQARLLFGPAILLEFFFFLALRNQRLGAIYAAVVIAFHIGVSSLMSLDFRHNIYILIIYFINLPHWIATWRSHKCTAGGPPAIRARSAELPTDPSPQKAP
jgi:hypothetical protein